MGLAGTKRLQPLRHQQGLKLFNSSSERLEQLSPPVKSKAGRCRLVDYAFAVTIRLNHGNAGEGKLLRHIQTTTLEAKRPMTWQGTKGKGDDEIRSVGAQEFNDLVPVMVQMGIGEQGLRKRSIT